MREDDSGTISVAESLIAVSGNERNKRFLSGAKERMAEFIDAAREYPEQLAPEHLDWLYRKPFLREQNKFEFFINMNTILGLVEFMNLAPKSRILEVGCGPGWITEILAMLGYCVHAFDPSPKLLEIARSRLEGAAIHYRDAQIVKEVSFQEATLEGLEFPDESFDAIIFYDILHHVVDEELGLEKCSKLLRRGGKIGIIEGAWDPSNFALAEQLNAEMAEYGTLENPFTQEYLDSLLVRNGFLDLTRLVGIKPILPLTDVNKPVAELLRAPTEYRNDIVATKGPLVLFSCDFDAKIKMDVLISELERENETIKLKMHITNSGDCVLIGGDQDRNGLITFSIRNGNVGSNLMREAANRVPLPRHLDPGESLFLECSFWGVSRDTESWVLDAICEHRMWLSSCGFSVISID